MKFVFLSLVSLLVFGQRKETLELEYKYDPMLLESYIKKENLGKILQQNITLSDLKNDVNFSWEITPYNTIKRLMPPEKFNQVDISKKIYFEEIKFTKDTKQEKINVPLFFDTDKSLKGCYYFSYKLKAKNEDKKKPEHKSNGIKALVSQKYSLVSPALIKIKDTEAYTMEHSLSYKWDESLKLDYTLKITSTCLVKYGRIRFEILEDSKVIYKSSPSIFSEDGQEKTIYPFDDRHFKTIITNQDLNYKKGKKYKVVFYLYSNDSNYDDFFTTKEFELIKK